VVRPANPALRVNGNTTREMTGNHQRVSPDTKLIIYRHQRARIPTRIALPG